MQAPHLPQHTYENPRSIKMTNKETELGQATTVLGPAIRVRVRIRLTHGIR